VRVFYSNRQESNKRLGCVWLVLPNVSELLEKGVSLLVEGNFEDALSYFEQALLLEPTNSEIWNKKGSTLRSLGRYDEALECFNRALELDPSDKGAS